MREYSVLHASTGPELAIMVNLSLEQGWKCQGGVSVAAWTYQRQDGYGSQSTQLTYAQAVIKD